MENGFMYDYGQLISVDTFDIYARTRLKEEFSNADDPENEPDSFLCTVQQFLVDYVNSPSYNNNNFAEIISAEDEDLDTNELKRKNLFKRAIIHQGMYALKNGYKYLSDGYDRDKGIIIDLSGIILAPRAEQDLLKAGFIDIVTGDGEQHSFINGVRY